MKKILPPKRFEDPSDPKFDSIRHEDWFPKLLKRREKIPALRNAVREMAEDDRSQVDVAVLCGVDPREMRDYIRFHFKPYEFPKPTVEQEEAIMRAYELYCTSSASWNHCLMSALPLRRDTRALLEKWEVDPSFFPNGYHHQ